MVCLSASFLTYIFRFYKSYLDGLQEKLNPAINFVVWETKSKCAFLEYGFCRLLDFGSSGMRLTEIGIFWRWFLVRFYWETSSTCHFLTFGCTVLTLFVMSIMMNFFTTSGIPPDVFGAFCFGVEWIMRCSMSAVYPTDFFLSMLVVAGFEQAIQGYAIHVLSITYERLPRTILAEVDSVSCCVNCFEHSLQNDDVFNFSTLILYFTLRLIVIIGRPLMWRDCPWTSFWNIK